MLRDHNQLIKGLSTRRRVDESQPANQRNACGLERVAPPGLQPRRCPATTARQITPLRRAKLGRVWDIANNSREVPRVEYREWLDAPTRLGVTGIGLEHDGKDEDVYEPFHEHRVLTETVKGQTLETRASEPQGLQCGANASSVAVNDPSCVVLISQERQSYN